MGRNEYFDAVDEILPSGDVFPLPEDWAQKLLAVGDRKESPTSISSYLGCPLRWYLERYSALEGGDISAYGVVGTFVHRVLEVFYTEPPELRTEDMLWDTYDLAVTDIQSDTDTGIIPEDLKLDFETVMESGNRGREYSMNWFFRRAKVAVGNIMEFDLRPDMLPVAETETWVRTKCNGVTVRGKIDRIITTSRGEQIDDFKTGRPPKNPDDVHIFNPKFVPMGLYAYMRSEFDEHGIPRNPVGSVRLLFLSDLKEYKARITPERMEAVKYLLERVTDGMNDTVMNKEIVVNPGPDNSNCTYCPGKEICPFFTGDFTELRAELGI